MIAGAQRVVLRVEECHHAGALVLLQTVAHKSDTADETGHRARHDDLPAEPSQKYHDGAGGTGKHGRAEIWLLGDQPDRQRDHQSRYHHAAGRGHFLGGRS